MPGEAFRLQQQRRRRPLTAGQLEQRRQDNLVLTQRNQQRQGRRPRLGGILPTVASSTRAALGLSEDQRVAEAEANVIATARDARDRVAVDNVERADRALGPRLSRAGLSSAQSLSGEESPPSSAARLRMRRRRRGFRGIHA
jgi:hypothetical protein